MSIIRASLKGLHSPDISDLESFSPEYEDSFGFLLQAFFGPEASAGEEAFDMIVCTPKWIEQELGEGVLVGKNHLIVARYDFRVIHTFLSSYARKCTGSSWDEVAAQLSQLGKWEFENYVECVDKKIL